MLLLVFPPSYCSVVFWKQLGAEREEELYGVGKKTEGQGQREVEQGTKGVSKTDSIGAQNGKAQPAELSQSKVSLLHHHISDTGWCSRQGVILERASYIRQNEKSELK